MAATLDTKIPNPQSNNDQQKIAETSFQDSPLTYVISLIRDRYKPNTDNGITFYYGIVTNIVTDKTQNYDRRDIFYSRIDGIERSNNTTTKYQSNRKIYFVHIPALHSIMFNYEKFDKSKTSLTPEDLYKFRIEEAGKDIKSVEIGNIVKIKFENNSIFSGGIIEQVVEDNTLQLKLDKEYVQKALENFEDYAKCVKDPLNASSGQGRNIFNSVLTTKDVISLGLFDFIEFFVNEFSKTAESKVISPIKISYTLETSEITYKAIESFRQQNDFFNKVNISIDPANKFSFNTSFAISANNVLRIILSFPNSNLVNYYIILLGTYGLQAKKINDGILEITFNVEQIEQKNFIQYSQGRYETLKEFNIAPSTVKFTQEQVTNAQSFTESVNTKCDNIVTYDLYIDTTKSAWKRQNSDKILLDYYFNEKTISSDKQSIKNYGSTTINNSYDVIRTSKEKISSAITNIGVDKNFYSSQGIVENNGLVNKQGKISVDKILNNLDILAKDMNKLQKKIAKNESLNDQTVLILPINWLEIKPRGNAPNGRDPNTQHWYGRAVDFVVYVKINSTIYQIPPEIVYLYIVKYLQPDHQNIGLGLFTSTGYYLHYEILDGIVANTQQQAQELQGRYWTTEKPGGDELEKLLNSVSPSGDFTSAVKEYVSKKYALQQIGLPNKIRNLL